MPHKATARDIVLAAYKYLAEITPPTQKISDVRIEEVEPLPEESGSFHWKVILSYDNLGEFPFDKKREYKDFKVEDQEGHKVISMKSIDGK